MGRAFLIPRADQHNKKHSGGPGSHNEASHHWGQSPLSDEQEEITTEEELSEWREAFSEHWLLIKAWGRGRGKGRGRSDLPNNPGPTRITLTDSIINNKNLYHMILPCTLVKILYILFQNNHKIIVFYLSNNINNKILNQFNFWQNRFDPIC